MWQVAAGPARSVWISFRTQRLLEAGIGDLAEVGVLPGLDPAGRKALGAKGVRRLLAQRLDPGQPRAGQARTQPIEAVQEAGGARWKCRHAAACTDA
jgi:hypothetical protein